MIIPFCPSLRKHHLEKPLMDEALEANFLFLFVLWIGISLEHLIPPRLSPTAENRSGKYQFHPSISLNFEARTWGWFSGVVPWDPAN